MSRGKTLITLLLFSYLFTGCGGADTVNSQQTEYIDSVPTEYFRKSERAWRVVIETYPSKDYTNGEAVTKTAYVYLPYGYDESNHYDIFYLMHGWTMTAGSFFTDSDLVNMLDNLIADGEIRPLIVVCATFDPLGRFYAENKPQSFSRSTEELLVFHNDLRGLLTRSGYYMASVHLLPRLGEVLSAHDP